MELELNRKLILLSLLLVGLLSANSASISLPRIIADVTIYIRADGSVDPLITPITSADNTTYIFTYNISGTIVVERDNITINSGSNTLEGIIDLSGRDNVTIEHVNIIRGSIKIAGSNNRVIDSNITNRRTTGWNPTTYSIELSSGSNNSIYENIIAGADMGIRLLSSRNRIYQNNITDNGNAVIIGTGRFNNVSFNDVTKNGHGIKCQSDSNILTHNRVVSNEWNGIALGGSDNIILDNEVTNNNQGIIVSGYNNTVTGNNIIENKVIGLSLCGTNNTLRNNHMISNNPNFEYHNMWKDVQGFINDVDTSNTVEGRPIFYWVNQENATIPTDAGYVALVNCSLIVVQGLNLTRNAPGILLAFTANSTIAQNNIVMNVDGIILYHSSDNKVLHNDIRANDNPLVQRWSESFGVVLRASPNNVIAKNNIACHDVGIEVDAVEGPTEIIGNTIQSKESLSEQANGVRFDGIGILIHGIGSHSVIYHNNFVKSIYAEYYEHAHVSSGYPKGNVSWDNGYPSGGNYWDDYIGVGSKGLGFPPYSLGLGGDQDRYPLMGSINIFDVGIFDNEPQEIDVVSNSTVSNFKFDISQKRVSFDASGSDQTTGFSRVTIPKCIVEDLWQGNCTVLVNGQPMKPENLTDDANVYLYFTYQHPAQNLSFLGLDWTVWTAIIIVVAVTLVTPLLYRRRRLHKTDVLTKDTHS